MRMVHLEPLVAQDCAGPQVAQVLQDGQDRRALKAYLGDMANQEDRDLQATEVGVLYNLPRFFVLCRHCIVKRRRRW